jgi:hypothetical protein
MILVITSFMLVCVCLQDTIGVNLAGLRHLQAKVEQRDEVALFVDATGQFKDKRKRSKKRAILTVQ